MADNLYDTCECETFGEEQYEIRFGIVCSNCNLHCCHEHGRLPIPYTLLTPVEICEKKETLGDPDNTVEFKRLA